MNIPCIGPIMDPDTLDVTWNTFPSFPASIPKKIPDRPATAAVDRNIGKRPEAVGLEIEDG